ncbi:hypothetical protein OESDEN_12325 [Oesophagostomum dentatum]|uniref:IFT80/172/WDR35 TPR domain-containing protein n=1 Tax=Oesophagostomum dentatum TaxID=61180 RepID=A0A0B1SXF5_OESDE|nr:hypothetical protein OESDEN_12325 [Oesophagostomum dentatum]
MDEMKNFPKFFFQTKICSVPGAPFCLVYTAHGIIAVSDRRVFSYTENGVVQQQFDFSSQTEKEFSAITTDTTGNNVVLGSFDRLRLFSWSFRRGAWEEGNTLDVHNLYICSALAWKADGSTVYCVMGRDRFIVAYTASSLIIASIESGLSSEIEWHSGGNEKFYFDFEHVCIIVNAGEITVVEYGLDGPLGWVRTELTSPHLISVSIAKGSPGSQPLKKIAYLTDPTSVAIKNLVTDETEAVVNHTTVIDWLELSESATKLLFRDKRSRLTLLDGSRQTSLLNFCTYVQWVPGSDVVVAQSGNTLHVWYNPSIPDQVTTVPIKGEVEAVLRDAERTEVIVQKIMELAEVAAKEIGGDGTQSYKVRASVAQLRRKFKEAEKIYLEQNAVEEAIEMYQTLHKWDEALELAKATVGLKFFQL